MFWFNKFVAALILPPVGPLLLAMAGVAMLATRHRRLGRWLAWGGLWILMLLSVPMVSALLTWAVATGHVLRDDEGRDAQALVVLGGGSIRHGPEYGGESLTHLSLERARYGARLARIRRLPVLVSGGTVFEGSISEARLIADLLEREFGVAVTWREERSRNTHENAVESARVLLPEGKRRILLVTHAVDGRRARREFAAAGFDVVLAQTVWPDLSAESVWKFIPQMRALRDSTYAVYEVLGNLKATLDGV